MRSMSEEREVAQVGCTRTSFGGTGYGVQLFTLDAVEMHLTDTMQRESGGSNGLFIIYSINIFISISLLQIEQMI
jgi:hypothetical protein